MNDIVLRNSSNILASLGDAQPSSKLVRRTGSQVDQLSSDVVLRNGQLEAGAFLSAVGMTHLGTLAAVAEAIVEMHPAAAQGCAQIMNAYGLGAAEIIRRTLG